MSGDLISREAALMALKGVIARTGLYGVSIEVILANVPTVEVEPVVRCEDCEYYVDAPNYVAGAEKGVKICRSPSLDFDTECGDQWMWMPPDGFCSNGVRRGEEVADG